MHKLSIIRMCTIVAIAIMVLIVLSLSFSCGTLDMELNTKVSPSGKVFQSIRMSATGMLGSLLSESPSTDFETEGWQINSTRDGDEYIFEASKTFERMDMFSLPQDGGNSLIKDTDFYIKGNIFFKEYNLETTWIANKDFAETGGTGGDLGMSEALLNSMFSINWAITLPGKIIKTNADKVVGNTGTWNFSYTTMQQDRNIIIKSRYINWPIIIGLSLGVFIIALAIILLPKFLRRKQKYLEQPMSFQE